jgi:hypothetical protein
MGEAMISPDEFLRRCEQVRAEFAAEGTERQQLTRELAALCALTGARAESVCDHNSQLTGMRVRDPGGNLVISGPVDEVLAELVAVPPSYQNRGPGRSASHRTRSSVIAAQPADELVAAEAAPDSVHLDLVVIDESGRARGRWTSRVRSRGS